MGQFWCLPTRLWPNTEMHRLRVAHTCFKTPSHTLTHLSAAVLVKASKPGGTHTFGKGQRNLRPTVTEAAFGAHICARIRNTSAHARMAHGSAIFLLIFKFSLFHPDYPLLLNVHSLLHFNCNKHLRQPRCSAFQSFCLMALSYLQKRTHNGICTFGIRFSPLLHLLPSPSSLYILLCIPMDPSCSAHCFAFSFRFCECVCEVGCASPSFNLCSA